MDTPEPVTMRCPGCGERHPVEADLDGLPVLACPLAPPGTLYLASTD